MYAILILSQSSKTMHLNSAHQSMKSCVRCLRCTSAYLADIFPVLHNPTSCNNCIILWNSIKRKEPLMKILVFDIGGTAIKYGICKNGHLEETKEYPTEAFRGGTHILNTICRLSEQYLPFDAIGISTAGQVNPDEGSIIYANSNIPDYTGTQFKKILQKLFHVPVAVENDVNSAALGEAVFGAGKGKNSFLCLTYGTGVGGAIIENKQVYHGSSFSAGEFGDIITHAEEKLSGTDQIDRCNER